MLGMSKDEYLMSTPGEISAKFDGWIYNRDMMSANFRELFALQFNQWAKKGQQKSSKQLWRLSFDEEEEMDKEEMYARNKKIIDEYRNKNNS